MTAPLRGRLAQILREAWHRSRAWAPGVQLPVEEFVDALLTSEEWRAREAELVRLRALLPHRPWVAMILAQPVGFWFGDEGTRRWAQAVLDEHVRLAADSGKEPDNATNRPA